MTVSRPFMMRLPLVCVAGALFALGLIYASAVPDVQIQLALLALD